MAAHQLAQVAAAAQTQILPEVVGPLRPPRDHGRELRLEAGPRSRAALQKVEQANLIGAALDVCAVSVIGQSIGAWEEAAEKIAKTEASKSGALAGGSPFAVASSNEIARIEATA